METQSVYQLIFYRTIGVCSSDNDDKYCNDFYISYRFLFSDDIFFIIPKYVRNAVASGDFEGE